MINRKAVIGWTVGGEFCHVPKLAGGVVVKNFQVLSMNGNIAAPPPPPKPKVCTYQDVRNYQRFGPNYPNPNDPNHCTPTMYNRAHPNCNYNSCSEGWCGNCNNGGI
jgi:hypothetical protein